MLRSFCPYLLLRAHAPPSHRTPPLDIPPSVVARFCFFEEGSLLAHTSPNLSRTELHVQKRFRKRRPWSRSFGRVCWICSRLISARVAGNALLKQAPRENRGKKKCTYKSHDIPYKALIFNQTRISLGIGTGEDKHTERGRFLNNSLNLQKNRTRYITYSIGRMCCPLPPSPPPPLPRIYTLYPPVATTTSHRHLNRG